MQLLLLASQVLAPARLLAINYYYSDGSGVTSLTYVSVLIVWPEPLLRCLLGATLFVIPLFYVVCGIFVLKLRVAYQPVTIHVCRDLYSLSDTYVRHGVFTKSLFELLVLYIYANTTQIVFKS